MVQAVSDRVYICSKKAKTQIRCIPGRWLFGCSASENESASCVHRKQIRASDVNRRLTAVRPRKLRADCSSTLMALFLWLVSAKRDVFSHALLVHTRSRCPFPPALVCSARFVAVHLIRWQGCTFLRDAGARAFCLRRRSSSYVHVASSGALCSFLHYPLACFWQAIG